MSDMESLSARVDTLEKRFAAFLRLVGETPATAEKLVLTDEQRAEVYAPIEGVVLTPDQKKVIEPNLTDEQKQAIADAEKVKAEADKANPDFSNAG